MHFFKEPLKTQGLTVENRNYVLLNCPSPSTQEERFNIKGAMYKENFKELEKFEKLDLLDREVDMLKQFIRYESASGYKEEEVWHTVNTRNNHKDRETGKVVKLPVFNVLRDGPKHDKPDAKGVVKTYGEFNEESGNEWDGFMKLTVAQQKLLVKTIQNISFHMHPHRQLGERLKEIRTDKGMKQKEFSEFLSKGNRFNDRVSWTTIRDLEFGSRMIPDKILQQIYQRCSVSREWILTGRGTKLTETNTLDVDRITNAEHRIMNLERVVDTNVGLAVMQRDGITDHNIPKASNYELRNELSIAQKELIEQRDTIGDLRMLVRSLNDAVENLRGHVGDAKAELEEAQKQLGSAQKEMKELREASLNDIINEMQMRKNYEDDMKAEQASDYASEFYSDPANRE
nr:hypothetical protein [uncultured Mediterranean phage uvMED]